MLHSVYKQWQHKISGLDHEINSGCYLSVLQNVKCLKNLFPLLYTDLGLVKWNIEK